MLKRFGGVCAASITLLAAIACTPVVQSPPRVAAPLASSASVRHQSPPPEPADTPTFVQKTGKAALTELPTGEATVIGRLETPHATYLLIDARHDQALDDAILNSVVDQAGNAVVSAVAGSAGASQSVASPEYQLIVRVPGQSPRTLPTAVKWTSRGSWNSGRWRGGYQQSLNIGGLESAPTRKELEAEFAEAMAHWFDVSGHGEPFAAYAAARLRHKFTPNSANRQNAVSSGEQARVALADLMDFYTARSAITDSLQTRRGLQLATPRQAATESLSKLENPAASSASIARAATPSPACTKCSGFADYIPAGSLAVEFATLKDLIQLPKLLDARLGPLLRVAEAAGGSNHLLERYRQQLAIELDGFAATVGQFAVRNAAVVLSDPYLREGTDLTLIFRAENPALLQGVLENHLQRAKLQHPDLRTAQEQLAGQTVTASTTTDGKIQRFEYAFDDYRIIANSRAALMRIIRTKQGVLPRLSQDSDYIAARATNPFDPQKERAFAFFGNGFVADVVGPRSKILESRRMRAKAELQAVDHAALLFGWMEGHRPSSLQELLQSGWLDKVDLIHFDASAISWSPNLGAHSAWGYAQSLTPIADLQLTRVSKDEVSAYRSFQRNYEEEMRGMLDPTALRFERTASDEGLATSLSVFPIPFGGSFNSEFRHEAELVGGGRIAPGAAVRGVSIALGIGDESPLRKLFDDGMLEIFGKRELSANFVGDWAKAGLDEGSAVWDLAAERNLFAQLAASDDRSRSVNLDELVPKFPVWVAVHVRSRLLLTAALATLRAKLDSKAPDLFKWHKDETYRGVPITRVRAAENGSSDAVHVDVYYAIVKDVFLVSLRHDVLVTHIDEVLAGRVPHAGHLPEDSAQWVFDWQPQSRGWLRLTAEAILDQAAIESHERACAGLQLLARGNGPLPNNSVERRALALRLLGYDPEPPQGGELRWQNGQCEGGHFGSVVEPNVPDVQNPNLLLHQVVSTIDAIRITLGTVQRQDALELRARFELSHVPSHPSH